MNKYIIVLFLSTSQLIAAIYPESPRERVEEKIAQLDAIIEKLERGNDLTIREQKFLTLKEDDDFFENRSFIALNFRNQHLQKIKTLLTKSSKFTKEQKLDFENYFSPTTRNLCWNEVLATELEMPIFLPEENWDEQFFSIEKCDLEQKILKTKNELTLYLKNQIGIDNDENYKKSLRELFSLKIPYDFKNVEKFCYDFIFEIYPLCHKIQKEEAKLGVDNSIFWNSLLEHDSILVDFAYLYFSKNPDIFKKYCEEFRE